jgi:hypothetical protein
VNTYSIVGCALKKKTAVSYLSFSKFVVDLLTSTCWQIFDF